MEYLILLVLGTRSPFPSSPSSPSPSSPSLPGGILPVLPPPFGTPPVNPILVVAIDLPLYASSQTYCV